MYYSSHTPRGAAEESGRHGLFGMARRILLGLAVSTAATAAVLTLPALASADTSTSLTIVGTSDVSDSGLMANVVLPTFEADFPQFTSVSYIGSGTGAAITSAETGANGASVLIVHAPSLENSFVSGDFSVGFPASSMTLSNNYGTNLFTNKFILAGSTGNANPLPSGDMHNMAQAFVDIANNGDAGHAFFISRGGTPGTTVEEHQIWGLIETDPTLSAEMPTDVELCSVDSSLGGGYTPAVAGTTCPTTAVLPTGTQLPGWYVVTGLTQALNVESANTCSSGSVHNDCFVFTDDGTYANVQNLSEIPNLTVVTSDNSATGALGGPNLLVNYFHGYIIDGTTCGCSVNSTAATDFINLLTTPSMQASIASYLSGTSFATTFGNVYTATAAPTITATASTSPLSPGTPTTVSGSVTNNEVGFPVLNGVAVHITRVSPGSPTNVASGTTASDGSYSLSFTPVAHATYDVTTDAISKVEEMLSPVFGDQLVPGATPLS